MKKENKTRRPVCIIFEGGKGKEGRVIQIMVKMYANILSCVCLSK